jgi:hypothetical protein
MNSATSANCPPATDAEMRGRTLNQDYTVRPTAMGYRNPGETPNLRGVEPNTNMSDGESQGEVPDTPDTPQLGDVGIAPPETDSSGDTYAGSGVVAPTLGARQSEVGGDTTQNGNTNLTYEVPGG